VTGISEGGQVIQISDKYFRIATGISEYKRALCVTNTHHTNLSTIVFYCTVKTHVVHTLATKRLSPRPMTALRYSHWASFHCQGCSASLSSGRELSTTRRG